MAERYQPLTPLQAERRMRECAGRLLVVIDDHGVAAEEEAAAIADHKLSYAQAYLASQLAEPKKPTDYHKARAEVDAGEQLRAMHAATAKRRALGEEAHSLRQVLSSIQSNGRMMQAAGA